MKRVLRYPYQNLDQLSVLVTESDEKAPQYKKPSDDTLHMLRNKYQYLKVLIIDEISKIGWETFGHLDLAYKAIKIFCATATCQPKSMLMKPSKGSYKSFNRWLWKKIPTAVIQILLN